MNPIKHPPVNPDDQPQTMSSLSWLSRTSALMSGRDSTSIALELFTMGDNGEPFQLQTGRFAEELGVYEVTVRATLYKMQQARLLQVADIAGPTPRVRLLIEPVVPASSRDDVGTTRGDKNAPGDESIGTVGEDAVSSVTDAPDSTSRPRRLDANDLMLLDLNDRFSATKGEERLQVLREVVAVVREQLVTGRFDERLAIEYIADAMKSNGLAPPGPGRQMARLLATYALDRTPTDPDAAPIVLPKFH